LEDFIKEYEFKTSEYISKTNEVEKNISRIEADISRIDTQTKLYEEESKATKDKMYELDQKKIEQNNELSNLNFEIKTLNYELRRTIKAKEKMETANSYLKELIEKQQQESYCKKTQSYARKHTTNFVYTFSFGKELTTGAPCTPTGRCRRSKSHQTTPC